MESLRIMKTSAHEVASYMYHHWRYMAHTRRIYPSPYCMHRMQYSPQEPPLREKKKKPQEPSVILLDIDTKGA